jgi:small subunit ribosomal protein S7
MRRKVKRPPQPEPDIIHNSPRVAKFMNYVMFDGRKEAARKVVYDAFEIISAKTKQSPLEVFETALKNAGPTLEVRSRRIGGANYQVPREVRPERRQSLAMRWIKEAARSKKGRPMAERLADELIAAAKNEGVAIKKKEDTHKMAEANKAFAHFAW